MKKKLLTMILLCTISFTMLSCNNDNGKTANTKDNKTTQSTNNDSKNDKQGSDDATVNRTYTELPKEKNDEDNSEEAPKDMTAEEKVAKFNELYPKMETFFKEKLEKPYISRGDDYKVEVHKKNLDIKGYKGISGLTFYPNQTNEKEFNNASFTLGYNPNNLKEIISFGGNLNQRWNVDDAKKNGFKIKGTLFEEFINILSTEKVDIDKLEKEANESWPKGYAKRYGHTVVGVQPNAGDIRVTVMIS